MMGIISNEAKKVSDESKKEKKDPLSPRSEVPRSSLS
jgi:hypothetical protein